MKRTTQAKKAVGFQPVLPPARDSWYPNSSLADPVNTIAAESFLGNQMTFSTPASVGPVTGNTPTSFRMFVSYQTMANAYAPQPVVVVPNPAEELFSQGLSENKNGKTVMVFVGAVGCSLFRMVMEMEERVCQHLRGLGAEFYQSKLLTTYRGAPMDKIRKALVKNVYTSTADPTMATMRMRVLSYDGGTSPQPLVRFYSRQGKRMQTLPKDEGRRDGAFRVTPMPTLTSILLFKDEQSGEPRILLEYRVVQVVADAAANVDITGLVGSPEIAGESGMPAVVEAFWKGHAAEATAQGFHD
jgi:hypothetical protein